MVGGGSITSDTSASTGGANNTNVGVVATSNENVNSGEVISNVAMNGVDNVATANMYVYCGSFINPSYYVSQDKLLR